MKILLVEDNDLNLEVAQYILEDAGAEIIVARNGLESVELFEQSESDSFDVILMDVMMPVMDGLTATKRIRKLKRKDEYAGLDFVYVDSSPDILLTKKYLPYANVCAQGAVSYTHLNTISLAIINESILRPIRVRTRASTGRWRIP